MPTQKVKSVAKAGIKAPTVSIQDAFDALCRHIKDAAKEGDSVIQLPKGTQGLRGFLKNHRKNRTSIEDQFVTGLVAALEEEDGDICRRLDGMTFIIIVETILQTDNCQICQRGLYLLAASLHQDNHQRLGRKRKEEIGSACLVLLLERFEDVGGPPELRRWIGILGLQLLRGSPANTSCVGLGPDKIRQGLGGMLTTEANEIVRFVAGKIIDACQATGTPLETLWPSDAPEESYVRFPQSSEDGWSQQFQVYIDDAFSFEGRAAQETHLYFAKDCVLKYFSTPSQQLGSVNRSLWHSLNITLHNEILIVHIPSSDDCPDQILDIPVPAIAKIILRSETATQSRSAAAYFLTGQDAPACILNGKEEDMTSIRIRGPPTMVQALLRAFEVLSPYKRVLDEDGDPSSYDITDDETNSHRSTIIDGFKAHSQEVLMMGSEAGSDFPHNEEDMGRTPTTTAFNHNNGDDDDLYDASPKQTTATQSPDELDHTRNNYAENKDNLAAASQSTSQGRTGFSKRGPVPSKSKSQAHEHSQVQDQVEIEEPLTNPKAKPAKVSKAKTGTQGKVGSQSNKLEKAGKRTSQNKSQTRDEDEEPVTVPKPKPKTGAQRKVESQTKDLGVGKSSSQANKRARAEAGEPAPASKSNPAVKPNSKTGTRGTVASQSKKLEAGVGKRTSRSNPQTQTELDEAVPRTKPAAKSKPHKETVDSQFNKARDSAKDGKIASQSESQTTTGRRNAASKIKPKAKAPITLPKSQENKEAKRASNVASDPAAESPVSESFQVSDEHNASTPKPTHTGKSTNKTTAAVQTQAARTKDQKGKTTSKVLTASKGDTAGDEYDIPPSSDDEGVASSNPKRKKNSKAKKGSAKKYGKARSNNVLPSKMELFQGNSSSNATQVRRERTKKSTTTKSSQLSIEDEIDDLQVPAPRKNPPRKSQEAKEPQHPPKVMKASKIPVARGKLEKISIQETKPLVQVKDKDDQVTPAHAKRKSRKTVVESNKVDYDESPMPGIEDDDVVIGVSPSQEVDMPDPVSLNQSQPKTAEKSWKSDKKHSPNEMANKLSQIFDEALVEDPPELRPLADVVDIDDPMDVVDHQNDLGITPEVQVGRKNTSPVESDQGSGDSNASRKRKAEVEQTEPSKKRRSFIQEDGQVVSSQQNVETQMHTAGETLSKPASEHQFKKPAVPRKSEGNKKTNPFLEPRAKSVGIDEASSLCKNLNTPAANEHDGPVAAAREGNSNAPLVDDSVHRKATLIAFNKSGPMNSGRLSATPKLHVEAILLSSSAKENQPARKRKLDNVEQVDVGSPPSKRRQSSPVENEDEGKADGNSSDFGDIDNGLVESSSPAPMSPATALKIPRKRHSSQVSRVDANGSPLPLGPVARDHMGIDGRIKEPSQPKKSNIPVVPGPFKANQLFGTKAKIGSQNKARPESPENVEMRYIPHEKTKSGSYEGVVDKVIVEPQRLADPFTEPHTRNSSGFTERLRSESRKPGGAAEQSILKLQAVQSNSFEALTADGKTQPVVDIRRSDTNKDTRKKIQAIQSALPDTTENAARNALLVCGGGVDAAINALMSHRATKRSSKKPQVFTDDPEKTLVGGVMEVPGMSSGSSGEDSNSDPIRSPLQEMSSNETWNVALRPHYANLKDAVHRVADEMIIRLANEEDQMGLLVKQYQEGGAKIVDNLIQKRTEEKAMISEGLMTKRSAMVKAYEASGKAIAKVVEATMKNPVSQFAEGWKARQAVIREKIRKGKGAD